MRQVIKAKDIQIFFGKGQSMSIKMMRTIKKELNKSKHQPITIDDFCAYFKIKHEEICPIIVQNESSKNESRKQVSCQTTEDTSKPTDAVEDSIFKPIQMEKPYQFSKPFK